MQALTCHALPPALHAASRRPLALAHKRQAATEAGLFHVVATCARCSGHLAHVFCAKEIPICCTLTVPARRLWVAMRCTNQAQRSHSPPVHSACLHRCLQVATRRTRTAGKVEIPNVDDHVSKLEHMGKETVKKLQDIKGAAIQTGVDISVPMNTITRGANCSGLGAHHDFWQLCCALLKQASLAASSLHAKEANLVYSRGMFSSCFSSSCLLFLWCPAWLRSSSCCGPAFSCWCVACILWQAGANVCWPTAASGGLLPAQAPPQATGHRSHA